MIFSLECWDVLLQLYGGIGVRNIAFPFVFSPFNYFSRLINSKEYNFILGQFGKMEEFGKNNEEWKMAVLRGFYFPYQCASAYFVCLIVALRLKVVRNPMGADTKRLTRIACIVVWCLVVVVNFLPIAASIPLAGKAMPCNPSAGTEEESKEHELNDS